MARVSTVFALVPNCVEQELVAERAEDDLVELPLHELVSVHLVDFILALTNSSLTAKTAGSVDRPLANVLLD